MFASEHPLRGNGHPADGVDGFMTRHFSFVTEVSVVSWGDD